MRWLLLINLLAVVLLSGAVAIVIEGTPVSTGLTEFANVESNGVEPITLDPDISVGDAHTPSPPSSQPPPSQSREGDSRLMADEEAGVSRLTGNAAMRGEGAPLETEVTEVPLPRRPARHPMQHIGETAVQNEEKETVQESSESEQSAMVPVPSQPVLRIATEGDFPPFNFRNENGEAAGFDVDVMKELCARLERRCSFEMLPWSALKPALIAGEVDVLAASLQIPDLAPTEIQYSNPYYGSRGRFVGPSDVAGSVGSGEAFSQSSAQIAVQAGTSHAAFLAAVYPSIDLVMTTTFEEALLMVETGKVEGAFGDNAVALHWLKQRACCKALEQPLGHPVFFGKGVGLAVRSGNEALVLEINRALSVIIADGTYARISDKYFGASIY